MIDADVRPIGTTINSLHRKLGGDAENPTHIFSQLPIGYRIPKGETPGRVETLETALLYTTSWYPAYYDPTINTPEEFAVVQTASYLNASEQTVRRNIRSKRLKA